MVKWSVAGEWVAERIIIIIGTYDDLETWVASPKYRSEPVRYETTQAQKLQISF